jgi:murein DD-endopeptidase MepM/ murein hydrolase activator NlpD
MCDGPRRTPEPFGEAAYRAEDLGLGTRHTAQRLLVKAPDPRWVEAVEGTSEKAMLWPVEHGLFGRGFGYTREHRRQLRHDGIDISASSGELIRSVNDGIVAYSDNGVRGYGNMIMVVHKDESVSFYCHQRANYVFAGQQVRRGQVLGEVGMTGIARGPHLHFEYHVHGRARDPMPRMVGVPTRGDLRHALLEI